MSNTEEQGSPTLGTTTNDIESKPEDLNHESEENKSTERNATKLVDGSCSDVNAPESGSRSIIVTNGESPENNQRSMSQAIDTENRPVHPDYIDVPPSYKNIPGVVPHGSSCLPGPPPSYNEVIDPLAAPPPYQSLFKQKLEAQETKRGIGNLLYARLQIRKFIHSLGYNYI